MKGCLGLSAILVLAAAACGTSSTTSEDAIGNTNQDATTRDALPGIQDSGLVPDSGGVPSDSGAPHDSGSEPDSGMMHDSGGMHDSGLQQDAGTEHDATTQPDSGTLADAGTSGNLPFAASCDPANDRCDQSLGLSCHPVGQFGNVCTKACQLNTDCPVGSMGQKCSGTGFCRP